MPHTLRLSTATPAAKCQRASATVVGFAGLPSKRDAGSPSNSGYSTYERVLRYPDGHTRRIRYPVEAQSVSIAAQSDVLDVSEDWQTLNAFKQSTGSSTQTAPNPSVTFTDSRRKKATGSRDAVAPSETDQNAPSETINPSTSQKNTIPSSPLELLRLLTSQKHKQEQQELWQSIENSYEILDGCPWPAPKPLYVLATSQADSEVGMTYTLRTRIAMEGVQSELASLLGRDGKNKKRPNSNENNNTSSSSFISCGRMVDGVIAFESDADAETFGSYIEIQHQTSTAEALGASLKNVSVARCDSHQLFRDVQQVKTVVVLLRRGCVVPQPHQLAAALRTNGSKKSSDGGDASQ